MNEKTLYLKYRPQTLDEIIGQEDVVKVLKNSIKNDKLSHAYLFTGSRGTGKTTTARAFAKELGVHKDDILELDAASNNGVEEMKAITESVYTLPFFSKYKMYILDEAHMLTKHASNAFLKTLEEPPKHVIFVLCTTDPEKMLETVLSRCTQFNLKSPSQTTLSKFLESVCKSEDIKMDKEAINLVAFSGSGSYRDSLSNMQKVLSFPNTKYTGEVVGDILGIAPTKALFGYLLALDGVEDVQSGIDVLRELDQKGIDKKLFARELSYFARLIILARHKLIKEAEIREEYGEHILEFLSEFMKNKKPRINSTILSKIIEAEILAKTSSLPFLSYELLLI